MGIKQYQGGRRGRYGPIRQRGSTSGVARRRVTFLCANFCLQRNRVVPMSLQRSAGSVQEAGRRTRLPPVYLVIRS